MKQRLFNLITFLCLAVLSPLWVHAADDDILIEQTQISLCEEAYCLSSQLHIPLHPQLKEVISYGMPLYFTTEIEITHPRWYWFNEKVVSKKRTTRISYNVLTRQYSLSTIGSLRQNYSTLEEALAMIAQPLPWVVAKKSVLAAGETYKVGVSVKLDTSSLPKPFQVHAMNSRKWRLSSEWKHFDYTVNQ